MDRLAAFAVMLFCWPVIALGHWELKAVDSTFQYGMQTNCMTCHSLATNSLTNKTLSYSADQYIDMRDSIFNNYVQLDFAWSIQSNLNKTK